MSQRVVHKFQMSSPSCGFVLPRDARVVKVGEQLGWVTLWIELDPLAKTTWRNFRVYATGARIAEGDVYVGTAFVDDLVWHVYEEPNAT
jgi:hypothetical protein